MITSEKGARETEEEKWRAAATTNQRRRSRLTSRKKEYEKSDGTKESAQRERERTKKRRRRRKRSMRDGGRARREGKIELLVLSGKSPRRAVATENTKKREDSEPSCALFLI